MAVLICVTWSHSKAEFGLFFPGFFTCNANFFCKSGNLLFVDNLFLFKLLTNLRKKLLRRLASSFVARWLTLLFAFIEEIIEAFSSRTHHHAFAVLSKRASNNSLWLAKRSTSAIITACSLWRALWNERCIHHNSPITVKVNFVYWWYLLATADAISIFSFGSIVWRTLGSDCVARIVKCCGWSLWIA